MVNLQNLWYFIWIATITTRNHFWMFVINLFLFLSFNWFICSEHFACEWKTKLANEMFFSLYKCFKRCDLSSGIVFGMMLHRWHFNGVANKSLIVVGLSREIFPCASIRRTISTVKFYQSKSQITAMQFVFTFMWYEIFGGEWVPMLFGFQSRWIEIIWNDM